MVKNHPNGRKQTNNKTMVTKSVPIIIFNFNSTLHFPCDNGLAPSQTVRGRHAPLVNPSSLCVPSNLCGRGELFTIRSLSPPYVFVWDLMKDTVPGVGFNPFEKYETKWIISPSRSENLKIFATTNQCWYKKSCTSWHKQYSNIIMAGCRFHLQQRFRSFGTKNWGKCIANI